MDRHATPVARYVNEEPEIAIDIRTRTRFDLEQVTYQFRRSVLMSRSDLYARLLELVSEYQECEQQDKATVIAEKTQILDLLIVEQRRLDRKAAQASDLITTARNQHLSLSGTATGHGRDLANYEHNVKNSFVMRTTAERSKESEKIAELRQVHTEALLLESKAFTEVNRAIEAANQAKALAKGMAERAVNVQAELNQLLGVSAEYSNGLQVPAVSSMQLR